MEWKRYCAQRSLTTCPCSGFLDPEDPTTRGCVLLPRGLPPPPAPATIFQFRGQWKRKDQAFLKDQAGSFPAGQQRYVCSGGVLVTLGFLPHLGSVCPQVNLGPSDWS